MGKVMNLCQEVGVLSGICRELIAYLDRNNLKGTNSRRLLDQLHKVAILRNELYFYDETVDVYKEAIDLSKLIIVNLPLSVRTQNCLKNAGIKTVAELSSMEEREVLKIPNFGRKSMNEIKSDVFYDLGITFKHITKTITPSPYSSTNFPLDYKKQAFSVLVRDKTVTAVAREYNTTSPTIWKHIRTYCKIIDHVSYMEARKLAACNGKQIATFKTYNDVWFPKLEEKGE
jgi:hypothetical protein